MPLSINCSSKIGESLAGPMVHTILALRIDNAATGHWSIGMRAWQDAMMPRDAILTNDHQAHNATAVSDAAALLIYNRVAL